ncbi:serine/threonine protein kinase [bacterium]|nr:MAG: serine/threonine protein kinase [bacterium]
MAKELTPTEMRGKRIGGCEIVDVIGAGGMGTVYLATQLALNKKVALKILDSKWAVEPKNVENFLREARLAAKLEDEHIVAIYDVGSDQGFHYIVMQLAKGETLKDRLKRGALELEEALAHIEGAAKGLAVAHSHNITHRGLRLGQAGPQGGRQRRHDSVRGQRSLHGARTERVPSHRCPHRRLRLGHHRLSGPDGCSTFPRREQLGAAGQAPLRGAAGAQRRKL